MSVSIGSRRSSLLLTTSLVLVVDPAQRFAMLGSVGFFNGVHSAAWTVSVRDWPVVHLRIRIAHSLLKVTSTATVLTLIQVTLLEVEPEGVRGGCVSEVRSCCEKNARSESSLHVYSSFGLGLVSTFLLKIERERDSEVDEIEMCDQLLPILL